MKTELKVKITRPYEEELIPESCHVIPMPDTWVSSAMVPEIRNFCPVQGIVISGPTGGGKTTLVGNICKHVIKNCPRTKVLLLENRTAIATQQKKVLAASLNSKWSKVQDPVALELTDEFEDVGLVVMTYQKFAARQHQMDLRQFAFVIFDEAHYFLSDSLFNPHLDKIFWKLPQLFNRAIRLYTTATPGAVLSDICAAENQNLNRCRTCLYSSCQGKGKLLFYAFPNHFDRVNLFYFRTIDEIAERIKSNPADKFLIFTSACEDENTAAGKSYRKALESHGVSVDYLDSGAKGTDIWREVCDSSSFSSQVLVSTSVLDCGVSFHDPQLKHIVVETADKTEFLQMLGRKRLRVGESINVYIRALGPGKFAARANEIHKSLDVIYAGFHAAETKNYDPLVHKGWTDESHERRYMHLLNYFGNGKVFPKRTADHYLRWQLATLERLLRDSEMLEDDSALPRLAHEWLEQMDGYRAERWLDHEQKANARDALLSFLGEFVGKSLTKCEWTNFSKQAVDLIRKIQKFPHDEARKKELKYRALNNRLHALNIPYLCQKTNDTYQLIAGGLGNDEP